VERIATQLLEEKRHKMNKSIKVAVEHNFLIYQQMMHFITSKITQHFSNGQRACKNTQFI